MTIHEMVNLVTDKLKEGMENSPLFPYDTKIPKEDRRKPHMLDMALKYNAITISPGLQYFELGNKRAETVTPHYHILEDAKIIRRPNKGTKKSRGSQASIGRKSDRDYGAVTYRETTKGTQLLQEYRQNMTRNYYGRIGAKTQPREYEKRKQVSYKNKRNYYENTHYQYIERILEKTTPQIAVGINAKLQIGTSSLLDGNILSGFLNDKYEVEPIVLEGIE
jgi:hypothetical protein